MRQNQICDPMQMSLTIFTENVAFLLYVSCEDLWIPHHDKYVLYIENINI